MVGLPVAVFLHNRFSASLFSPPRLLPNHDRLVAVVAARPRSTTPQRLSFFAYISLTDATPVHTPLPPRPPRGGLYLNNIHELRYTRQIYCSDTRGFERPSLPSLQPSPPPPLLFSPSPRILLLRFEIETFSLLNEISFFFLLPSLRYFSPLFFSIAIDFSPFFVSLSSFFPYTSDFTNRRSLRLIIICVFVVI